jgi:TetR/AcrR family transcriptional regulator, regulator of cefoperazone and chloramphenicol sensitivity
MGSVSSIKRRRSQVDTKAKLLKAALDVFAKSGYDAATTRNIAKKAGVNESLIHRYFESKLGLFIALKNQFREGFIKEYLSGEMSDSLTEELSRFMKTRLRRPSRDKKFFKLSLARAIVDSKFRFDMRNYASMRPPEITAWFAKFRDRGQIDKDTDLDQFVGVLYALAFSFMIMVDVIECLPTDEVEKLIRMAAGLLSEGLKPKA